MKKKQSSLLSEELAGHIGVLMRLFLVADRHGAPAEGLMRFNPFYFGILRTLGDLGPTRPGALAQQLGASKTTVSSAVRALIQSRLLSQAVDPEDARARLVSLTPAGEGVAAAIVRQDIRNATALLDHLEPEQQSDFVRLFRKIVAGMAED